LKSDLQKLQEILTSVHRTEEEELWLKTYLERTDASDMQAVAAALFREHLADGNPLPEGTSRRMWEQIQANTQPVPAAVIPLKRSHKKYWWAAAAVATGIGLTIPILRQQPKLPPAAVATKNITPATNKAVLTLADGSKITLNDTASQEINTTAAHIRQQKGQLQYSTTGANVTAFNKLETPRGGVFQVVLPDGSHVWLNAASSLKYPITFTDKRIVELEGQAYFDIAPNTKQPFIVKVHDMEVQVLGTSFDIMAYQDEASINTTLVTGAVKVKQGNNNQLLHPGQQAILNSNGKMDLQPANLDKVLAWRNGRFELENTDLPAFLRQLARWYDIEIDIAAPEQSVAAKKFGGQIGRDMNLNDVMKILELYNVHCQLNNRKLTILSVAK